MLNKQLIEWIKTQKQQKQEDKEIRKILLEKGWLKKDIDKAISFVNEELNNLKTHFSLNTYIKSLSISVAVIFLFSFIFLLYSFNFLIQGSIFFIHIVGMILLTIKLKKFNKLNIANGFTIVYFIILCALSMYLENFYFLSIIMIICIFSLIHQIYFKKQEINFEQIFITYSISLTFGMTITFLLYLAYAYLITLVFDKITILMFLASICIIFFISTYCLIVISKLLLKKTQSIKDDGAALEFKKEFIRSIKPTVYSFLVFFIIFLCTTLVFAESYTKQLRSNIQDENKRLITSQIYELNRQHNLLTSKGYSEITAHNLISKEGRYIYSTSAIKNANLLYYNCDSNLTCESKEYNSDTPLEKQASLTNIDEIIVAENNSIKAIFLYPQESFEQKLARSPFEFEDSTLKYTGVAKELDIEWNDINKKILEKQDYDNNEGIIKISYFYSGKILELLQTNIFANYNLAINIYMLNNKIEIVLEEYSWIKNNSINKTPFYDDTQTLTQHIQKLEEDIAELYPEVSKSTINSTVLSDVNNIDDYLHPRYKNTLFGKASIQIFSKSFIYDFTQNISDSLSQISNLKKIQEIERINEAYLLKNDFEENIQKALYLRLLKSNLLDIIYRECTSKIYGKYNQNNAHYSEDKYYQYALEVDEECTLKYSKYDIDLCTKMKTPNGIVECLNKYP